MGMVKFLPSGNGKGRGEMYSSDALSCLQVDLPSYLFFLSFIGSMDKNVGQDPSFLEAPRGICNVVYSSHMFLENETTVCFPTVL